MRKAFIHLHPRLDLFIYSIVVCKRLAGISHIVAFRGPTLQEAFMSRFQNYISLNSEKLAECVEAQISSGQITSLDIFMSFKEMVTKRVSLQRILKSKRTVFKNAAIDSLIRRRISYVYLFSPGLFRKFMEEAQILWTCVLYNCYKAKLVHIRPDYLVTSHACYSAYIAMIEAALDCGIRVQHVSDDQISRSILEHDSIYHGFSILKNVFDVILKRSEEVVAESSLNYCHDTDVQRLVELGGETDCSEVHGASRNSDIPKARSCICIYTHCIKDANTIFGGNDLFSNYFDWLVWITLLLFKNESDYDRIVFKIHPHSKRYQDYFLLRLLGLVMSLGVNSKRIIIDNPIKQEETSLLLNQEYDVIPVTFNGSICLEHSVQFGIRSIACGNPACPREGYVRPNSRGVLRTLLLRQKTMESEIHLNVKNRSSCQKIALFKSSLSIPCTIDRNYLERLRRYFFFDKSAELDMSEVSSCYKSLMRSLVVRVAKLSMGCSFLYYK